MSTLELVPRARDLFRLPELSPGSLIAAHDCGCEDSYLIDVRAFRAMGIRLGGRRQGHDLTISYAHEAISAVDWVEHRDDVGGHRRHWRTIGDRHHHQRLDRVAAAGQRRGPSRLPVADARAQRPSPRNTGC